MRASRCSVLRRPMRPIKRNKEKRKKEAEELSGIAYISRRDFREMRARLSSRCIIALFLSNGKDRRGPARLAWRGGGGRETCTARFLAAMIGSGRQYSLNRWAVSKREYSPISPTPPVWRLPPRPPPARDAERRRRPSTAIRLRPIGPVSLRIFLGAPEAVRPALPSPAR